MEAKFRQINKFVEVLDHALGEFKPAGPIPRGRCGPAVDPRTWVAGKGYLTFAACHEQYNAGACRHAWRHRGAPGSGDLCNRAAQRPP
jgi:hypothetical protein